MDWLELNILDHNEEDFERGSIEFPLICDYTVTRDIQPIIEHTPCECYLCSKILK